MKREVKITLHKDANGKFVLTANPQIISMGEEFLEDQIVNGQPIEVKSPMTITWVLEEKDAGDSGGEGEPNAKKLTIQFLGSSPFQVLPIIEEIETTTPSPYVASVSADAEAQLESQEFKLVEGTETWTFYEYEIEVIAKSQNELGEVIDLPVTKRAFIKGKRGTVRKGDVMDDD